MQKERFKRNDLLKNVLWLMLLSLAFFVHSSESFASGMSNSLTAQAILAQVNQSRIAAGLQPLKINQKLQIAAEDKAHDMVKRGYFSHADPQGNAPWMWIEHAGYDYTHAGENLAIGFLEAKKQNDAWMQSEFHRRNILNAQYRDTGIAVVTATLRGVPETVVVEFFGRSSGVVAVDASQNVNGGEGRVAQGMQALLIPVQNVFAKSVRDESLGNVRDVPLLQGLKNKFNSVSVVLVSLIDLEHLWRAVFVALLIVESVISIAVALRIYWRVYKHAHTIDLRGSMM